MEKKIEKLMKSLDCTREEALQILADDAEIEKGEKLFELTPEQKKNAKKYTKTGTRKSSTVTRERKIDFEKEELLARMVEAIRLQVDEITAVKNETEFSFRLGTTNFTVKLIRHRTPKK